MLFAGRNTGCSAACDPLFHPGHRLILLASFNTSFREAILTLGYLRPFEPVPPVALPGDSPQLNQSVWRHRGRKHRVVAFDFGIKYNILRCLETTGFDVVVVPADS